MKDYELKYLRKKLIQELEHASGSLLVHKELGFEDSLRESTSELSTYDNHPADTASETFELEKQFALSQHQQNHIKDIEEAVSKMDKGKYGICDFCSQDIGYERLDILPTAKLCIHCQTERKVELEDLEYDRPVEEDLLKTPFYRTFTDGKDNVSYDGEDAWQDVQKYGSASGPQDISVNGLINYQNVYYGSEEDDDEGSGEADEVENISNEQYKNQLPDSHGNSFDGYVETDEDKGKDKRVNYFGEEES